MGSGASANAGRLSWPADARAFVYPGAELPNGLKLNGPTPCSDDGVSYWQLGGPAKARLRVTEDSDGRLKLGSNFTVGLCCRVGAGNAAGYDSILLGEDNKHWLAFKGGDNNSLCCVEDGGTAVLGIDGEGLVDLGCFPTSLTGSKLRNSGWATNEIHVAAIAVWDRCLSWSELSAAAAGTSSPAATSESALLEQPPCTSFQGRVLDLEGRPLPDVRVAWSDGGCQTNKDGYFFGSCDECDAETDVPDDGASEGSRKSTSSSVMSISFECDGFAPTAAPVNQGIDNSMRVTMRPISASALLDPAAGGSVSDPVSGSSVTVPPNSLVYADGRPAAGPVTLSFSVIDVTDPAGLASMPGDFSAIGADGSEVMLESLGAAWISATDEAGEKLEVNNESEGVVLDLQTQARANAEKLGTVPEMWSFNDATGKWELETATMKVDGEVAPNVARPASSMLDEEPKIKSKKKGKKAALSYDPDRLVAGSMSREQFMERVAKLGPKSISASIKKMGYINCDIAYQSPMRAVMLKGLVLDASKQPMPRVQLWAVGRDYQGRTADVTCASGRFGSMVAQFDSEVDIEVQYRRPSQSNDIIEVFFESPKLVSKLLDDRLKNEPSLADLNHVTGQYRLDKERTIDGQPTWVQARPPHSTISWCHKRRRWENNLGKQAAHDPIKFVLPAGDEPGLPFADGWLCMPSFSQHVPVPKFTRGNDILSQKFGPFKTGPPGEFVDVGELQTDA